MPKTYKVPFQTALRGFIVAKYGAKGHAAASLEAGKSASWLNNILRSRGYMNSTVETLYGLLPELREAVGSGAVAAPPRIKRSRRSRLADSVASEAGSSYERAVARRGKAAVDAMLDALSAL